MYVYIYIYIEEIGENEKEERVKERGGDVNWKHRYANGKSCNWSATILLTIPIVLPFTYN